MGEQLLSGLARSTSVMLQENKAPLKRGWGLNGLSLIISRTIACGYTASSSNPTKEVHDTPEEDL